MSASKPAMDEMLPDIKIKLSDFSIIEIRERFVISPSGLICIMQTKRFGKDGCLIETCDEPVGLVVFEKSMNLTWRQRAKNIVNWFLWM